MKFTASKQLLDQQLQHISRVVTTRQSVPILSNVLIETDEGIVRFSGSDIDLAVTTHMPADISEQGAFTVPAKVLQEFVHQNPDDAITFTLEGMELVAKSAKVIARMGGMDADEYPPLPQMDRGVRIVLPLQGFVDVVKQVIIACANDQSRPVLTGVFARFSDDFATFVATDSFRLVERKLQIVPMQEEVSCVIPARTIQEIIRISGTVQGDVGLELELAGQQLLVRIGEVELHSRLVVGTFPKYQAIIPTQFMAQVEITTSELVQALRLSYVFAQSGVSNILLELDEQGVMSIVSYGSQKGTTKHELYAVPAEGFQPIKVPFNA